MVMTQPADGTASASLGAIPPARAPVLAAFPLAAFPLALRVWLALCALGAASLVAARAVHYLSLPLPSLIERLIDRLMQASLHTTFLFGITLVPSGIRGVVLILGLLAFVVRPRWYLRRQEEGRWATRPWFYGCLFSFLSLGHVGFDMNPWVSVGCAVSGALALAGGRFHPRKVAVVLVACFLAAWAAFSPTHADAAGVLVWGAILALLALLRRWWLTARDVFWLGVFLAVIAQIAASAVPIFRPAHGGTLLGKGMAYGFCEDARRGRLYAAVPGRVADRFRTGRIVEYDAAQLTKLRDLSLFDPQFSGRLMQLLCLPDTIQAAMAQTWFGEAFQQENVLEFRIDDPKDVKRSLFGGVLGQQLLWDQKRDAVFYSSEWSNVIFRLDRRTGRVDRRVTSRLIRDRPTWLFIGSIVGSLAMAPTPHRGRDAFYVGHWLTGSTVYEIDLGRLTVRRQFEPRNGCIADLALDEAYERVFATSVWGVDVINLRTGRVERRIRTGTGARTPAIDTRNGLIYIPTTVEGKLRAFDRATLDLVGEVAVGAGSRRAYFQASAGRLFATNDENYYWWDAAALAARLRAH
jgi:hypothetical protein